jgi:2'-5' RNA ligase
VRLFVALELPEEARLALTSWRAEVVGGQQGLRMIESRDLHATLCFLGWRSEQEVAPILAACGVVASEAPPELRLGQAIWLPPHRPRVLAVTVEDPDRRLARVQSLLSDALAAGGWYEPEKRPYLGHVTVARVSRGARPPRAELPAPPALPLRGRRVTLYRSELLRTGARYEALGTVELGVG